jgi:hypothetical protein
MQLPIKNMSDDVARATLLRSQAMGAFEQEQ